MTNLNKKYLRGKLINNKRIQKYFDKYVGTKVTYWKPFIYGKHTYVMSFQYSLYQIELNWIELN